MSSLVISVWINTCFLFNTSRVLIPLVNWCGNQGNIIPMNPCLCVWKITSWHNLRQCRISTCEPKVFHQSSKCLTGCRNSVSLLLIAAKSWNLSQRYVELKFCEKSVHSEECKIPRRADSSGIQFKRTHTVKLFTQILFGSKIPAYLREYIFRMKGRHRLVVGWPWIDDWCPPKPPSHFPPQLEHHYICTVIFFPS